MSSKVREEDKDQGRSSNENSAKLVAGTVAVASAAAVLWGVSTAKACAPFRTTSLVQIILFKHSDLPILASGTDFCIPVLEEPDSMHSDVIVQKI